MPTEDPRRDDLRIGGWLETFPGRRALPGRPPLVTPPPPRVPVFRPLRPRRPAAVRPVAAIARVEHPRQVRLRVALTCLAVTAVGAGAFLALADRAGDAPPLQQMTVADPVTMGPMPFSSPSAVATTSASPSPGRTSPTARHAREAAPHTTAATAPAAPPSPAVIGGLRVGDTVSLAAQGRPAGRARHQARPAGLGRFMVRGAPTGGCVAFESADRPGYFLRHRDFVIHLDRADGSSLFRLDSAFCPVPSGDGGFRLRSANYPDRFVTAGRGGYYLAQVPPERATSFAVQ